jgi:hypothetical protein
MTEKELYAKLREILPGDFLRVENGVALGVPDINVCYQGLEVWIEAKLELPQGVLLRKFQYAWGIKRTGFGGVVFLIAQCYTRPSIFLVWPWDGIKVQPYGNYLKVVACPAAIFDVRTKRQEFVNYIFNA